MADNCISTDTGNKTLFETQNYEESKCPSGTLLKEWNSISREEVSSRSLNPCFIKQVHLIALSGPDP